MDCIRPETITLRSVECESARPRDISLEFFLDSVVSGIEIRVEGEKTGMAILPALLLTNVTQESTFHLSSASAPRCGG